MYAAPFLLGTALFLLNDLAWLLSLSYQAWVLGDWAIRFAILGFTFVFHDTWRAVLADYGRTVRRDRFLTWLVAIVLAALVIANLENAVADLNVWQGFFFPVPSGDDTLLRHADLIVGLGLVAVSETLVGLQLPIWLIERHDFPRSVGYVGVVVLFALWHWSLGPVNIVGAGLMQAVFLFVYLKARSPWPVVIGHYLADFLVFQG